MNLESLIARWRDQLGLERCGDPRDNHSWEEWSETGDEGGEEFRRISRPIGRGSRPDFLHIKFFRIAGHRWARRCEHFLAINHNQSRLHRHSILTRTFPSLDRFPFQFLTFPVPLIAFHREASSLFPRRILETNSYVLFFLFFFSFFEENPKIHRDHPRWSQRSRKIAEINGHVRPISHISSYKKEAA